MIMNTDDKNTSYQTPEGLVQGTPDIAVPKTAGFQPATAVPVGGVILADGDLQYNTNRNTVTLKVRNTGDRPIQIGSHFHFFEVNRYLEFDRKAAFGMHLNIPATTAVRFEPGEEKEVELCSYYGKRRVIGFNDLVNGYRRRHTFVLSQEDRSIPPHAGIWLQGCIGRRSRCRIYLQQHHS